MKTNLLKKSVPLLALSSLISYQVQADESLSVVGSWSGLPLHKQFEQPFWTNTISNSSDFDVSLTTHDQMGIGTGDVFRMLGDGVFDIAMTVGDYAVADAPELEGLDVPLMATTPAQAQKAVEAARPMVEEIYADTFNAKVLAIVPYPPQVVFCKPEITSLSDLENLKVRASGRMTAKLLDALGAQSVNISFGEVPGALQRGVIDCAVTGAGSGYSAGWWEVTETLMTLPLGGWDPVVTAINLDKWEDLSQKDQEFLQTQVTEKFEKPVWASAQAELDQDVACLTGNASCARGPSRNMTLVEPSSSDIFTAKRILIEKVLPEWADRAGSKWVKQWNASVGKIVNLEISGTGK
ncbi:TRAP transporter substrate-binding protein [Marinomonas sp. 5E14-1]|uniref:TRAP transporter substrate-binding protein n=1 Tax=Marinomonas sp. 5E14-1 TaxID=3153922 RepID=UPI003264ED50